MADIINLTKKPESLAPVQGRYYFNKNTDSYYIGTLIPRDSIHAEDSMRLLFVNLSTGSRYSHENAINWDDEKMRQEGFESVEVKSITLK